MNRYIKLSEINFGSLDAETEVTLEHGKYFDIVYHDPFNTKDRIRNGKIIVHGRKGTGKSALACYLQRSSGPNLFVQKFEYSMKDLEQIVQIPDVEDPSASMSQSLWHWIFLCALGKFILDDQSIALSSAQREEFGRFYKINQGYCSPGSLELKQQVESEKLQVRIAALNRLLSMSGISEVESIQGRASFLKIINPLQELMKNTFMSCKRDVKNEYFIIIDNLDIEYTGTENQKNALLGLIRAAKNLFTTFREYGVRICPIVLIRSDMLEELKYEADTNKIALANGLKLNWYDHDTYLGDEQNVPLRNLISSRIKYSYKKSSISITDGWHELFRDWNHDKPSFKYLIDKTLYRPRDLICLFNLLSEKFPKADAVTKEMVDKTSKEFAAYMVGEWQNELSAHLSSEKINKLFDSLKLVSNNKFTFETFKQKNQFDNPTAVEFLETAFIFGLICAYPVSNKIAWSHRPSPDFDNLDLTSGIEMGLHFAFNDHFVKPSRRTFWTL
ncbi:MAG: hypothetical protein V4596_14125 [Bdellovibrionota bacterium]